MTFSCFLSQCPNYAYSLHISFEDSIGQLDFLCHHSSIENKGNRNYVEGSYLGAVENYGLREVGMMVFRSIDQL